MNFGADFPCDVSFELLGQGATSKVYLAKDKKTKNLRAVKIIERERVEERKYIETEVEIMRNLPFHPNVVHLYEAISLSSSSSFSSFSSSSLFSSLSSSSSSSSRLCLILEYCDEGDLELFLEKREGKGMEVWEVLLLVRQLAFALRFLFLNRVCHRDLKPRNLFLKSWKREKEEREGRGERGGREERGEREEREGGEGRGEKGEVEGEKEKMEMEMEEMEEMVGELGLVVKLADFGLAKRFVFPQEMMESNVGTALYSAPEVIRGSYDSLSDLWSVGAIIYQMLTGEKIYTGKIEAFRKQLSNEPIIYKPELQNLLSKKENAELADLLDGLLKKDPKERITWSQFFSHPWLALSKEPSPSPTTTTTPTLSSNSLYNNTSDSPFQITSLIGKGRSSKVYLATSKKTHKIRALKIVENFQYELQYREREREILSVLEVAREKPEFLVKMYERLYLDNGEIMIVLEYCNEGDLGELLKKKKRLSEVEVRGLMYDFFCGLTFLQSRGILHRDLKPSNLFLKRTRKKRKMRQEERGEEEREEGERGGGEYLRLKIGDFGFAKQIKNGEEQEQEKRNPTTTIIVGTPAYFAPEIWETKQYNLKSDLWSAGVILYQILYGQLPFPASNPSELIQFLEKKEIAFPTEMDEGEREGEERKTGEIKEGGKKREKKEEEEDPPRISKDCLKLMKGLLQKKPKDRLSWRDLLNDPWIGGI